MSRGEKCLAFCRLSPTLVTYPIKFVTILEMCCSIFWENFVSGLLDQSEFVGPLEKGSTISSLVRRSLQRFLRCTTQCLSKEVHFTRSFLRSEALFSSYRDRGPILLCSLSFFVGFPTPLDDTLDFPPLHSWTSHARFVYCDLSIRTKANFLKYGVFITEVLRSKS